MFLSLTLSLQPMVAPFVFGTFCVLIIIWLHPHYKTECVRVGTAATSCHALKRSSKTENEGNWHRPTQATKMSSVVEDLESSHEEP